MKIVETSTLSIIAGLVLGSAIIISVIYNYYRRGDLRLTELVFVLFGLTMVGFALWRTIDINWTKGGGVRASFEMIERDIKEVKTGVGEVREEVSELERELQGFEENNRKLARAYFDSIRYIIDEHWGEIYLTAEKIYMESHPDGGPDLLDDEAHRNIAGLALLIREEIFSRLTLHEDALIRAIGRGEDVRTVLNDDLIESLLNEVVNR